MPKVTVVVACFDQGAYLEAALDSVRGQTLRDVEVIVIDDGSTDPATLATLRGLAGRPDVQVVRIENRGLSGARNEGIRRARAPYVCTLDADDLLEPGWLEAAARLLDEEPGLTFVSHWFRAFGDEAFDWTPQRCDLVSVLEQNRVNGAALARKAALVGLGLFDESFRQGCEDWELWVRVLASGHRGAIIPAFMFRYRRRAGSMSRTMPYLELHRRLIELHAGAHHRHLLDLLQRSELHEADRRVRRLDLARELEEWLAPEVERRRAEVRLLEDVALRRREALAREVARVRAQVDDVRASWSWRVTSPLRAVAGLASGAPTPPPPPRSAAGADALAEARHDLACLRGALSWRLTAPLRAVVGLARGEDAPA